MAPNDLKVDNQGGSGKMLLILGLLGGLGIGGGVGYSYSKQNPEAPHDDKVVKEEVKQPKGEPQIVEFQRLAVPIYSKRGDSTRFVGNFFVDIKVVTYGEENQLIVRRAEPRLQHAFLSAISKNDLMREDSPQELDIDKAGKVLKAKADEILGPGIANNVLIINAMRLSN